nr:LysM peptidoglycan-binding domain-containing protein [Bacteroidales bacterium]
MEKITIQKGDTLSGLANKYGITVSALMAANPNIKDPNLIIAGNSLNIPTTTQTSATSPSATPPSATPTPASSYTIKSGDTLSQIAQAQGTTIAELMKLNPQITNPNLIYTGKTLTLPGGGSTTPNYSSVNSIPDANDIINANQAKDAASANVGTEPETRKTVEDYMKEITETITPKTAAPAAPDYQATYEQY